MPAHHVFNVAWQRGSRAEQIDPKNHSVHPILLIEQMLQRCVEDDATVPELIGADFDHRQRWWESPARHDVLWLDILECIVEVNRITSQAGIYGHHRRNRP